MSIVRRPEPRVVIPTPPGASSPGARAVMRGNRRRDTRAELALRSALHAMGLRYRLDLKIGPGRSAPRPDVVFPRARVAVFVDGCFWHGCPEHGVKPRTNSDYWRAKLARNEQRDASNDTRLSELGWQVVRVWEHEDPQAAARRISGAVQQRTNGPVPSGAAARITY